MEKRYKTIYDINRKIFYYYHPKIYYVPCDKHSQEIFRFVEVNKVTATFFRGYATGCKLPVCQHPELTCDKCKHNYSRNYYGKIKL